MDKKTVSQSIKYKLAEFLSPKQLVFWITLAFIIKLVFFLLKVDIYQQHNGFYQTFGGMGGDTKSYIEPIENLIRNGEYYNDYRMPGYGSIYFLLRIFLSQSAALNTLIILQLVLSSLSVYALGLSAWIVFKHKRYFYGAYFLYLISTYVSLYDGVLLTESFSASAIIFSLYFLLRGTLISLILSGLMITWLIFLRPVYSPLLLLFSAYLLLVFYKRDQLKKYALFKAIGCFLIPFLIIDGLWIGRNYLKYEAVYPLTKTMLYPGTKESYTGALFNFINSFGGSIVHWQPGSEITFFIKPIDRIKVKKEAKLPNYIYTSAFTYDSLVHIRELITVIRSKPMSPEDKAHLNKYIKDKLDTYAESIQREKPILYYIGSRFLMLKTFFIHSGTYNLFTSKPSYELTSYEMMIKIFYSLLYISVVFFGFIGLSILLFRGIHDYAYLLLASSGFYCSLIFPFVLKMDENRYFVPGYPLFVLATVWTVFLIADWSRLIFTAKDEK